MADKKKVKINVHPSKAEATYSDFAIISKNALGITFDFGQRMPGGGQVNIVSRVAMSPQHAKLFAQLLAQNIKKYEDQYGSIDLPKSPQQPKNGELIHFMK
jgi:hypothetical protein